MTRSRSIPLPLSYLGTQSTADRGYPNPPKPNPIISTTTLHRILSPPRKPTIITGIIHRELYQSDDNTRQDGRAVQGAVPRLLDFAVRKGVGSNPTLVINLVSSESCGIRFSFWGFSFLFLTECVDGWGLFCSFFLSRSNFYHFPSIISSSSLVNT